MRWFKWLHHTYTDPKFRRVAKLAEASLSDVIAVWVALHEHASQIAHEVDVAPGNEISPAVTCHELSVTSRDINVTSCDEVTNVTLDHEVVTTSHDCVTRRGDIVTFDCDDHDLLFDFSEGKTAQIVTALTERGLIVDGRIFNWDLTQQNDSPIRANVKKAPMTAAERKKKQRDKERAEREAKEAGSAEKISGGVTKTVTANVTHVTKSHGVTPREEKKRKEKDKSFTPKPLVTSVTSGVGEPVCDLADRANRLAEINQEQIREALGVPVDPEAARAQLLSKFKTSGVHGNA
jgi:proteasome lid subunit RPN8/RPN11